MIISEGFISYFQKDLRASCFVACRIGDVVATATRLYVTLQSIQNNLFWGALFMAFGPSIYLPSRMKPQTSRPFLRRRWLMSPWSLRMSTSSSEQAASHHLFAQPLVGRHACVQVENTSTAGYPWKGPDENPIEGVRTVHQKQGRLCGSFPAREDHMS